MCTCALREARQTAVFWYVNNSFTRLHGNRTMNNTLCLLSRVCRQVCTKPLNQFASNLLEGRGAWARDEPMENSRSRSKLWKLLQFIHMGTWTCVPNFDPLARQCEPPDGDNWKAMGTPVSMLDSSSLTTGLHVCSDISQQFIKQMRRRSSLGQTRLVRVLSWKM